MKGVFQRRPVLPKASCTWDVGKLLEYLNKLSPPKALNLQVLSHKLVTLLLLLSGQRGQSIHLLRLEDCECTDASLVVRFNHVLKQTRPGFQTHEVCLPAYKDVGLCIVHTFQHYVSRTKQLRSGMLGRLLLATVKPHHPISRDTVSNWVRKLMRNAGINLAQFTPHSTRAASTSAALEANVPISTILNTAGWSQESTFRKFYAKPVQRSAEFANSILSAKQDSVK